MVQSHIVQMINYTVWESFIAEQKRKMILPGVKEKQYELSVSADRGRWGSRAFASELVAKRAIVADLNILSMSDTVPLLHTKISTSSILVRSINLYTER